MNFLMSFTVIKEEDFDHEKEMYGDTAGGRTGQADAQQRAETIPAVGG